MSARLTLLLLCDQYEPYFLFISALKSEGFQVLLARTAVRAKRFLSATTVNAILILDSDYCHANAVCSELKRMAPGTPILLRSEENQERLPGIDSLWQADLQDEVVVGAVAAFFRQSLETSRPVGVTRP
ncbi:MAG: hypothetical protein ABSD98_02765 [Candidatus Korobacteraceae bacterium]|jgi:DNA-binding response OmpR family regulator